MPSRVALTVEEVNAAVASSCPSWAHLWENDPVNRIERSFKFKSFGDAFTFVIRVGVLSDRIDHHPRMVIDFDTVEISLTTNDRRCVTMWDIDMANQIDELYRHSG